MTFETNEFYLRDSGEMGSAFTEWPEALVSTLEIAERCSVELELGRQLIPSYPTPDATSERDYLRAMADVAADGEPHDEVESVPTSDVASALGKKPQSLSPARDSLLKKGLVYSGERGKVQFTVPHLSTKPASVSPLPTAATPSRTTRCRWRSSRCSRGSAA